MWHGRCCLYVMRVAVPIWKERISSVFDVAGYILLIKVKNGEESSRTGETLSDPDPLDRARKMACLGTDVLICGAISRPLELALKSVGIRVIAWTCGPVEDVLEAFLSGHLTGTAFLMPGCDHRRLNL